MRIDRGTYDLPYIACLTVFNKRYWFGRQKGSIPVIDGSIAKPHAWVIAYHMVSPNVFGSVFAVFERFRDNRIGARLILCVLLDYWRHWSSWENKSREKFL